METVENLKKQLHEVNRDIEGMLTAGATTEKKDKADEPVIVGIMIIPLN